MWVGFCLCGLVDGVDIVDAVDRVTGCAMRVLERCGPRGNNGGGCGAFRWRVAPAPRGKQPGKGRVPPWV